MKCKRISINKKYYKDKYLRRIIKSIYYLEHFFIGQILSQHENLEQMQAKKKFFLKRINCKKKMAISLTKQS